MDQSTVTPVLPGGIVACLFDLDGVPTQTAKVHAAAWKETFDAFLGERAQQTGEPPRPFDLLADYTMYVDGKLRQDGVRAFLGSRGIILPEGAGGVGVDRVGQADALRTHGADRVVNDLCELLDRR